MNQLYALRNEIEGLVEDYAADLVDPAVAAAFLNYADGWIPAPALAYSSADAPSYEVTCSGDYSGIITPGCRVKLTHSGSTKYFIVTKASHADGTTTITLYGGTDYTLAAGAITSPYFSTHKAPRGFPLSPAKWTVTVTDSSERSQGSPVANTWYNLGSISISIPIGCWWMQYCALLQVNVSPVGWCNMFSTLSTSNNSESHPAHTLKIGGMSFASNSQSVVLPRTLIDLATKTTYYLNGKIDVTGGTDIYFQGAQQVTKIELVCAYL